MAVETPLAVSLAPTMVDRLGECCRADNATYLSCLNNPVDIVQQRRQQKAKKGVRLSKMPMSAQS